ncbi:MAG: kelch repeat-containing protein [Herbinix sp.]|nr:kelch repeat-containing protein [Herbinix sp.]
MANSSNVLYTDIGKPGLDIDEIHKTLLEIKQSDFTYLYNAQRQLIQIKRFNFTGDEFIKEKKDFWIHKIPHQFITEEARLRYRGSRFYNRLITSDDILNNSKVFVDTFIVFVNGMVYKNFKIICREDSTHLVFKIDTHTPEIDSDMNTILNGNTNLTFCVIPNTQRATMLTNKYMINKYKGITSDKIPFKVDNNGAVMAFTNICPNMNWMSMIDSNIDDNGNLIIDPNYEDSTGETAVDIIRSPHLYEKIDVDTTSNLSVADIGELSFGRNLSSCVKYGNGFFIIGGYYFKPGDSARYYDKKILYYNINTKTITTSPNAQYNRYSSEAVLYDNKIYLIGGSVNTRTLVEIYDIETNSFSSVPNSVIAVTYSKYIVNGDKIYVIGGYDGTFSTNTFKIFNMSNNTMTDGALLRKSKYAHTVTLYENKIYVIGGRHDEGIIENLKTVEIYDISSNTWSDGTSSDIDFVYPTATLIDNKIYIKDRENKIRIYNISSDSWSISTAPTLYKQYHKDFVYKDKIYYFGGLTVNSKIEIYDIKTDTMSQIDLGIDPNYRGTGIIIDNKIYNLGGYYIENSININSLTIDEVTIPTSDLFIPDYFGMPLPVENILPFQKTPCGLKYIHDSDIVTMYYPNIYKIDLSRYDDLVLYIFYMDDAILTNGIRYDNKIQDIFDFYEDTDDKETLNAFISTYYPEAFIYSLPDYENYQVIENDPRNHVQYKIDRLEEIVGKYPEALTHYLETLYNGVFQTVINVSNFGSTLSSRLRNNNRIEIQNQNNWVDFDEPHYVFKIINNYSTLPQLLGIYIDGYRYFDFHIYSNSDSYDYIYIKASVIMPTSIIEIERFDPYIITKYKSLKTLSDITTEAMMEGNLTIEDITKYFIKKYTLHDLHHTTVEDCFVTKTVGNDNIVVENGANILKFFNTKDDYLSPAKISSNNLTNDKYAYVDGAFFSTTDEPLDLFVNNTWDRYQFSVTNEPVNGFKMRINDPFLRSKDKIRIYKNRLYIHNALYNIYRDKINSDDLILKDVGTMSLPRSRHNMVAHNNKIYFIGGRYTEDGVNKYVLPIEILDIETGNITTGPSLPLSRYYSQSFLYEDNIYIVGGSKSQILKYDLFSNTIITVATLSHNLHAQSSILVDDNIYIMGGEVSSSLPLLDTLHIFNINSNTITNGSNLPFGSNYGSCHYYNGNIYRIGGRDRDNTDISLLYIYNIETDSWRFGSPLIKARTFSSSHLYNGKIYMIAGSSNNSIEVYDIEDDTWTSLISLPHNIYTPISEIINNKIYIIGGLYTERPIYVYDIDTNTYSQFSSVYNGQQSSSTLLGNTIYYSGGELDSTQFTNKISSITVPVSEDLTHYNIDLNMVLVKDDVIDIEILPTDSNQIIYYNPLLENVKGEINLAPFLDKQFSHMYHKVYVNGLKIPPTHIRILNSYTIAIQDVNSLKNVVVTDTARVINPFNYNKPAELEGYIDSLVGETKRKSLEEINDIMDDFIQGLEDFLGIFAKKFLSEVDDTLIIPENESIPEYLYDDYQLFFEDGKYFKIDGDLNIDRDDTEVLILDANA